MDDTVDFHIYIDNITCDSVASGAQQETIRNYIDKFNVFLKPYIEDYIWQQDVLKLRVWTEGTPHVWGRSRFGDNIDDEWYIVMLMLELTKQFNDISVRMVDSDGEFLMIEAAYAIPKWLKPDNSGNRIWLRHGLIYIIPLPMSPASLTLLPTVHGPISEPKQAVSILCRDHYYKTVLGPTEQLLGSLDVQQAIIGRINKLLETLNLSQHHFVKVRLPVRAAMVLHTYPFLVAPAVNAFYYRDLDDMKPFANKETDHTKYSTAILESEYVDIRVRFTRCLYAQLYHQQFNASSSLFPVVPPASSPNHLGISMGIKLAAGIQILFNRLKIKYAHNPTRSNSETHRQGPSCKDTKSWELKFLSFIELGSEAGMSAWLSGNNNSNNTPPNTDDSWMTVSPQFIDQLLQERAHPQFLQEHVHDDTTPLNSEAEKTLDQLAKNVSQFVHDKSDYEGAEIRSGDDSDLDISEDDSSNNTCSEDEDDITFEPENFVNILQQIIQPKTSTYQAKTSTQEMDMKSIMVAMDEELGQTNVRTTFVDQNHPSTITESGSGTGNSEEDNLEGDDTSLDLDFEVVKHLLSSVSQEHGMPGPASTLLTELFKKSL
eukprot:Phypoly_transcript_02796.p1 GENE.Phypoly_transcript_02796~~Phypoly_transcript_02796.p1  ORF type:complete len:622 (+),score=72.38 Phypoly_transcript_02796:66-1868(+)